ncbi:MAG: glycosyltransferase family 39 protein, partial [Acidobacteriota bacterium]
MELHPDEAVRTAGTPDTKDLGRVALGLFVFFQALYALTSSGNAFRVPDEFEVYFQTEHLIDAGDLSVPQANEIRQPVVVDGKVVGTQSMFFGKVGLDGKPYAPYGPLAAVLAVPHHLAGRALASLIGIHRLPRAQGLAWVIFVGGITMLASATAAALAVVGFHRAAVGLGTPPQMALLLSLILGGASVLWPYATSFFSEAYLAAAFIWAAALLLDARTAAKPFMPVAIAALLIVVAGLTKMTSLIVAPAFVVAVLAERSIAMPRRLRVALLIGGAILLAGVLQLGWNVSRFGSPFEFGYDWSETIPVMPARAFAIGDIPRGLAVLLFSPGKSLLLWAPILVVAVLNASATWRRDRGLAAGLAASLAVGLLAYAAYLFPEGGYAHGPRHLVPIIPLLALAAAGPHTRGRKPSIVYACAAVGFVMAVMATRVSYLEDQALRRDANGAVVANYYEEINPAPGRPNNRYRLEYIPFATAMKSPGWSESPILGQGPDYFYKHLQQARRQLPDGQSIPASLPFVWPAMWGVIALCAAAHLARHYGRLHADSGGIIEPTADVQTIETPIVETSPPWPETVRTRLQESPVIRAVERRLPLLVIVLAGVLLASDLNQGWVPFDEGALGQAAERVLAGQVPHRDYDDIYTGGLAYLHAAFFSIGSHTSTTLRLPLFLFALPWVAALYAIARRFVPPFGAALVAVTAVVWSVPNYPAAMPSWFNVFFATFGALALLRGLESGRRHWFVLAGMAGGLSFLFKLSGIFFLLGGGIALIASSFRSKPGGAQSPARSGAALVTVILILVLAALALPISRAGTNEITRFLLPLGALFAALIWREWKHGGTTALERGRALFETLGPFVLGALLPLMVYAGFLMWEGALSQTIDGVLVKPFRRLDSAMMHPPPPSALINSVGLGLLLAWSTRRRATTIVAIVAAIVLAVVVYASADNPRIYAVGVLSVWGLPFLAAAGAAWLVVTGRRGGARRSTDAAVVITAIACAT